ncbi:hypothetical protein CEXT_494231 [Caerostris extrusa]|uniref:Uncharacterized protein n=1 Tax=Caerostris extrusa TaxID=172846 RepID=A0AAV4YCF0_CAEEX|nr:hypothetical protein CEXT_494231 [Caerostris extrusa]
MTIRVRTKALLLTAVFRKFIDSLILMGSEIWNASSAISFIKKMGYCLVFVMEKLILGHRAKIHTNSNQLPSMRSSPANTALSYQNKATHSFNAFISGDILKSGKISSAEIRMPFGSGRRGRIIVLNILEADVAGGLDSLKKDNPSWNIFRKEGRSKKKFQI